MSLSAIIMLFIQIIATSQQMAKIIESICSINQKISKLRNSFLNHICLSHCMSKFYTFNFWFFYVLYCCCFPTGASWDSNNRRERKRTHNCRRSKEAECVTVGSWAKKEINCMDIDGEMAKQEEGCRWHCWLLHPKFFTHDNRREEEEQQAWWLLDYH